MDYVSMAALSGLAQVRHTRCGSGAETAVLTLEEDHRIDVTLGQHIEMLHPADEEIMVAEHDDLVDHAVDDGDHAGASRLS